MPVRLSASKSAVEDCGSTDLRVSGKPGNAIEKPRRLAGFSFGKRGSAAELVADGGARNAFREPIRVRECRAMARRVLERERAVDGADAGIEKFAPHGPIVQHRIFPAPTGRPPITH